MSNRNNQRQRGSRRGRGNGQSDAAMFRNLIRDKGGNPIVRDVSQALGAYTLNATTGNLVVALTPDTLTSRTAQLADQYNLYRYKGLEVTLLPGGAQFTAAVIIDAIDVVSSSSFSQASASILPFSATMTAQQTVPTSILVPPSAFKGKQASVWYKSQSSSTVEAWDEVNVALVLSGAASGTVQVYLRWLMEFTDPAPGTLLPNPYVDLLTRPPKADVSSIQHPFAKPRSAAMQRR